MGRVGAGVGDDDRRARFDHDGAEADLQRFVGRPVIPRLRLEELAGVVDQGHQRDRGVAELSGQSSEAVERCFRTGVEDAEAVQCGKTPVVGDS